MVKDVSMHRSLRFCCPFFKWDGTHSIHGECGEIIFKSKEEADYYMKEHCCKNPEWNECTLAQSVLKNVYKEN